MALRISSYRSVMAGPPTVSYGVLPVQPVMRWPMAEPDEVLDYSLDIGSLLAEVGDSIASASLAISPSGAGELTATNLLVTGTVITAWLGGGVPGRAYTVRIEATTNSAPLRTFERLIGLTIDATLANYPQPSPPSVGFGPVIVWPDLAVPSLDFSNQANSAMTRFLGQPLTSVTSTAP